MKEVSSMILWEYIAIKLYKMSGLKLDDVNSIGSEGWELVLKTGNPEHGIFKRPYKLCSDCETKVAVTISHCSNCGAPVA